MKKFFALLMVIFLVIAFGACSAAPANSPATSGTGSDPSKSGEPAPSGDVSPSPSPSETPAIEKVFGKAVKIAVLSNGSDSDSALFFAGVQNEAAALGIEVVTEASGEGFDSSVAKYAGDGADAIIAYYPKPAESYSSLQAALDKKIPVSLFELKKGDVPVGVSHTYYNGADEIAKALNACLDYPPHEAPVRLISLFENKKDAAYSAYSKYLNQGKIFPKELYIAADSKQKADAWLSGKLGGYYAGMLDAVFAGSMDLALKAGDVLKAKKRSDMEVFCPGISQAIVERMTENPDVFAQAIGANEFTAGVLNVRIAAGMIKGGQPATEEFLPVVLNAADLVKSGEQAAFAALAGDQAAKYNESWMDTLRAAYAK